MYDRHLPWIEAVCRLYAMEELCDIGPGEGPSFASIAGARVERKGFLEPAAVSAALCEALAGAVIYDRSDSLARSGIYAAFAAHGTPVLLNVAVPEWDGLKAGYHYKVIGRAHDTACLEEVQKIADNNLAWYRGHDLCTQAAAVADMIGPGEFL